MVTGSNDFHERVGEGACSFLLQRTPPPKQARDAQSVDVDPPANLHNEARVHELCITGPIAASHCCMQAWAAAEGKVGPFSELN